MNTNKTIVHDGQVYHPGETPYDLGSFECIGVDGNRRSYMGLSADIGKLPKYDNLATGSFALCIDTGATYFYHAPSKTWYEQ